MQPIPVEKSGKTSSQIYLSRGVAEPDSSRKYTHEHRQLSVASFYESESKRVMSLGNATSASVSVTHFGQVGLPESPGID